MMEEVGNIEDGDNVDAALQKLKHIADKVDEVLFERKEALRQMAMNERKIEAAQRENAKLLRRLLDEAAVK